MANKQWKWFTPTDDKCLDCAADITPYADRNYIVWVPADGRLWFDRYTNFFPGVYRRQCAKCHDAQGIGEGVG